jgi:hypothetical protein
MQSRDERLQQIWPVRKKTSVIALSCQRNNRRLVPHFSRSPARTRNHAKLCCLLRELLLLLLLPVPAPKPPKNRASRHDVLVDSIIHRVDDHRAAPHWETLSDPPKLPRDQH